MSSFGLTSFNSSAAAPVPTAPVASVSASSLTASSTTSSASTASTTPIASASAAASAATAKPVGAHAPRRASLLRLEGTLARLELVATGRPTSTSGAQPSVTLLEALADAYWTRQLGFRRDNITRALLSYRAALRASDAPRLADDDRDGDADRRRVQARLKVKVARGALELLRQPECFDKRAVPRTHVCSRYHDGVGVAPLPPHAGAVGADVCCGVHDAIASVDAGLAMYTRHPHWIDDMPDARVYLTGWVCRGLLYELVYRSRIKPIDHREPTTSPTSTSTPAPIAPATAVTTGGMAISVHDDDAYAHALDECIRSLDVAFAAGDDSTHASAAPGMHGALDMPDVTAPSGVRRRSSAGGGAGAERNVIARCHARLVGLERARSSVALARAYCAGPHGVAPRARRSVRGVGSLLNGLAEAEARLQAHGVVGLSFEAEVRHLRTEVDLLNDELDGGSAVASASCVLS